MLPVIRNVSTFELRQGIKAFLNLEAGITRGRVPELVRSEQFHAQTSTLNKIQQELRQTRRELENKNQQIDQLREQVKHARTSGADPKNFIWILGSGRSGSTWVANMMRTLENHTVWEEPRVGEVFGEYVHQYGPRTVPKTHILSSYHKQIWLGSIRTFILDGAVARFPWIAQEESEKVHEEYLVIKEPNGSVGAPFLLGALPESRMIFLIRDPRDVCASVLDGARKGNWLYMTAEEGDWPRGEDGPLSQADTDPDAFVEERANQYLRDIRNAKLAYEAHEGRKVMVRYEDLRADALVTMKRIYSALEIAMDNDELARVVNEYAWENIPEKDRGEGKFHRKATPGGWREDLTPVQVEIAERITAPLLEEFYPGTIESSLKQ